MNETIRTKTWNIFKSNSTIRIISAQFIELKLSSSEKSITISYFNQLRKIEIFDNNVEKSIETIVILALVYNFFISFTGVKYALQQCHESRNVIEWCPILFCSDRITGL